MSISDKSNIDKTLQDAVVKNADGVHLPGVAAVTVNNNGIIYTGEAGLRAIGSEDLFTIDTPVAQFSAGKAVVSTAALQLVERGLINLDDPLKNFVDYFKDIQVLDGFEEDGKTPITHTAKSDVTLRQLLTHTSGFSYHQSHELLAKLVEIHPSYSNFPGQADSFLVPLVNDPGVKWEYGFSIDWVGKIVEIISGLRLHDYLKKNIFDPLGMKNTTFVRTQEYADRQARLHNRGADGELTAIPDILPLDPEEQLGGQGLFSSTYDYSLFLAAWLNYGVGFNGARILEKSTVDLAIKNNLPDGVVVFPRDADADAEEDLNIQEHFPGVKKSFGLSFLVLEEGYPTTGREAGSICWAGFANTRWWVDFKAGVAGAWSTQVFPPGDPLAQKAYFKFEKSVYDSLT